MINTNVRKIRMTYVVQWILMSRISVLPLRIQQENVMTLDCVNVIMVMLQKEGIMMGHRIASATKHVEGQHATMIRKDG